MSTSPWGRSDALIARLLVDRTDWLPERVLARLDGYPSRSECWLWTGFTCDKGYGRVYAPMDRSLGLPSRIVTVHRAVWIAMRGGVPDRHVLDHDGQQGCRVKRCANPAHLQAVTNRHNTVISPGAGISYLNAAKTHCLRGHELTGDNITAWTRRAGARGCRTCEDARQAERHKLVRNAADALGMGWEEYIGHYGSGVVAARRVLGVAS